MGDRVLIEPVEPEETIAGGMLVLPKTAQEKPRQGNVLAAGEGRPDDCGQRFDVDVQVGDLVPFADYSGSEIKLGRKKLPILTESDILGIVDQA